MSVVRTRADSRRWMAEGTRLALEAVGGLGESDLDAPSLLPDWTRRHVVAHLAANADAIANLAHWAATGIETPMYASPEERAAGIARGLTMPAVELDSWLRGSADRLGEAMDGLTGDQWQHEVVTAQGRTVPASETPWMRAREVCVHAVDLDTGIAFADLPAGFNRALCEDILAKRGMSDLPSGLGDVPLAEVTAWLSGRPHSLADAPVLGPWL